MLSWLLVLIFEK
uniref:Uncharacterized protein n=1 Tax=Arundo donax TaxID=35708 RepID=A0A0A8YRE4_ARUDO